MLRLAAVALGIVALGVAIGALIAYTIPPASISHAATSWGDRGGNRRDGTALNSDDQTALDNDSAPPPTSIPAQLAAQPGAADLPYGPDDRDRIDGRDEPRTTPGYNVNGGDALDPVDDRVARAADAAREAAGDARTAAAAPPEPGGDDH
jgi:hypothetical protein